MKEGTGGVDDNDDGDDGGFGDVREGAENVSSRASGTRRDDARRTDARDGGRRAGEKESVTSVNLRAVVERRGLALNKSFGLFDARAE